MTTGSGCPACSYENPEGAANCGMCGELLSSVPVPVPELLPVPVTVPSPDSRGLGYLVIGALLAPILSLTPILRMFGWFFSSLFHETGHTAVAWFFGMPAYPAIRIDGHAASFHQPQILMLALGIFGALGVAAWKLREHRPAMIGLAAVAVSYPLFAFTGMKEVLHLTGGHLGELTFATIFFWRALTGGFTKSPAERACYAMLAWYLYGGNVLLCAKLMVSRAARAAYAENGSFGLANDYIRLAQDVLGCSLPTVAAMMLLVSLAPLPLAIWLGRGRGEP